MGHTYENSFITECSSEARYEALLHEAQKRNCTIDTGYASGYGANYKYVFLWYDDEGNSKRNVFALVDNGKINVWNDFKKITFEEMFDKIAGCQNRKKPLKKKFNGLDVTFMPNGDMQAGCTFLTNETANEIIEARAKYLAF